MLQDILTKQKRFFDPAVHTELRGQLNRQRRVILLSGNVVANSRSDVSGVSARDFYQAYAAGAQNLMTFVTRFIPEVNTGWRVSYLGEVYEILQVNPLQEKRDFMMLKTMLTKAD